MWVKIKNDYKMKVEITQRFATKIRSESKNVAGKAQMPEVLRGSLTKR
jgi:hypothetical protein